MKTTSKLALIAAALISSSSAFAATPLWEKSLTRSETVKYKVSSVTTTEGATALYAKLQEAAERVCSADAFEMAADKHSACVGAALDSAVRSVAVPLVSALHLQAAKPATVASR